jgi:hypothetical protein
MMTRINHMDEKKQSIKHHAHDAGMKARQCAPCGKGRGCGKVKARPSTSRPGGGEEHHRHDDKMHLYDKEEKKKTSIMMPRWRH